MYQVVARLGDTLLEVRFVDEAEVGITRVGLVDYEVTKTELPPRSLPYTRGDDRRVVPYIGVALVAHIVLWGVATKTHPPRDTRYRVVKRERPIHVARFADANVPMPDVIREDKSEDTKEPGMGTAMQLDVGESGAQYVESDTGHVAVAQADERPRVTKAQAIADARTAGYLGSLSGDSFRTLTGNADLTSGFEAASVNAATLGGEGASSGGFAFGRSGFGPGGGGTGWGTIGTGNYGSWSNGSSDGHGWGGSNIGAESLRNHVWAGVTITICGKPYQDDCMLYGDIDASMIRRLVKRNASKIAYCWERKFLAEPKLSVGPLRIDFTIAADGKISKIETGGIDEEVASCVAEVYRAIQFPTESPLMGRHVIVYNKSTHT